MEYMSTVPDKFFDLAIVDPPYGIGDFNQSDSKYQKINWNDTIPDTKYFYELKRISTHRIIWGANYYNCFEAGAIVWYKENPHPSLSQAEIASVSIGKKVHYIKISHQKTITKENGVNRIHPCQKPIDLYKWTLNTFAKPGQKIFDSHLGSGSIAIACHDYKFDLVACEIDKDYFEAANKRYLNHIAQTSLF